MHASAHAVYSFTRNRWAILTALNTSDGVKDTSLKDNAEAKDSTI